MASLLKPTICGMCGLDDFVHQFKPERWSCKGCGNIEVERPMRDPTKCRDCGASRDDKEFKDGKNLCLDCFNTYMRTWREENQDHWREYRNRPEVKKARKAASRKAVQRSPKAFIQHLITHITKRVKYKTGQQMIKKGKLNPICLDVDIDFDYLWSLWESQGGLCALSQLPMVHVFNDLCSISVDRIDSSLGYVPGNVQLVCKWVNLAKGGHSNTEFFELLDRLN